MLNTVSNIPLWPKSSRTRESSVFTVLPGKVVALFATGFSKYATQEEGSFRTEQMACIERVLYEFAPDLAGCVCRKCGWVLDLSRQLAEEIASDSIAIGSCEWTLSQCHNFGIIGIPGTYRLVLNDDAAIGVVQVYASMHDIASIAPQCTGAFFQ